MKHPVSLFLLIILLFSAGSTACQPQIPAPPKFNAENAYQHVQTQMGFGARYPGSAGHAQTISWLSQELKENGWEVQLFEYPYYEAVIINVVAHKEGTAPHILLGAHFDTRLLADQDAKDPQQPVPGANDGASGVAVLLELSRIIPQTIPNEITLAFFDFEDQGGIGHYQWIAGSTALAEDPNFRKPDQVVVVDMIGDKDLSVYLERNSDRLIADQIWSAGAQLGYEHILIPQEKYSILDDHTAFNRIGIPAVDMIDFDYPYWHTSEDDLSKISSESLGVIGETLLYWLSNSNFGT